MPGCREKVEGPPAVSPNRRPPLTHAAVMQLPYWAITSPKKMKGTDPKRLSAHTKHSAFLDQRPISLDSSEPDKVPVRPATIDTAPKATEALQGGHTFPH